MLNVHVNQSLLEMRQATYTWNRGGIFNVYIIFHIEMDIFQNSLETFHIKLGTPLCLSKTFEINALARPNRNYYSFFYVKDYPETLEKIFVQEKF